MMKPGNDYKTNNHENVWFTSSITSVTKLGKAFDAVSTTFRLFCQHLGAYFIINLIFPIAFFISISVGMFFWVELLSAYSSLKTALITSNNHNDDYNDIGNIPSSYNNNNYYYTNNNSYKSSANTKVSSEGDMTLPLATFFLTMVLMIAILIIPTLTCTGATIRATAEIYAGKTPQAWSCLKVGFKQVCRLLCCGCLMMIPLTILILIGGVFIWLIVTFGMTTTTITSSTTPTYMNEDNNTYDSYTISAVGWILLFTLVPLWIGLYSFIMLPFQMAPPSLVIENRHMTVCNVITRAWTLSNGGRWTIFFASFMLSIFNQVIGMLPLVNLIWVFIAFPIPTM